MAMTWSYYVNAMGADYMLSESELRSLSAKRGFRSLHELARAAGLHRNTLRGYCQGEQLIVPHPITRIADVLEVDPLTLYHPVERAISTDRAERVLGAILKKLGEGTGLGFLLIGSRARGNAKKYSDIDVGVTGGMKKLGSSSYLGLKSKLEDAVDNFTVGVDLVNLDTAPSWFLESIDYAPRHLAGDRESSAYFLGMLDGIRQRRKNQESTR